ncbi:MAG: T9SS type A sorting domain-containing protein [Leptospiraceae bacterium]|nr:T9SS type A sorting domain-containing protein [Leptospiraceae bacterium]
MFAESINAGVTTTATLDNVSIISATPSLSVPGGQAVTSLNGQMPELSADVYPNPTEGRVTVAFSTIPEARITIRVFNSLGEQVLQKQVITITEATEQLDLSELADGVYTIRVDAGISVVTKRIVLAKASGLRP